MSKRVALVVSTLAGMPTATPTVRELATSLGQSLEETTRTVANLERRDLLETWPCPDRVGERRVMIGRRVADLLGIILMDRGTRWSTPTEAPPATKPRRRKARARDRA